MMMMMMEAKLILIDGDDDDGDYKSIMQTWVRKVRTRRRLGHLVVLPKTSTALQTIFVVAKTLVVLFNRCVNIESLKYWIINSMDISCISLYGICIVGSDFPSRLFNAFPEF